MPEDERNRDGGEPVAPRRVLIVGCGYVGLPLGAELARLGCHVVGLRRTLTAAREMEAAGIRPFAADVTRPERLARLPGPFDWVINCVASSRGGLPEYQEVYLQGTRNLIEWLRPSPPARFVYTSSTGVYAQNDGSEVTETSVAEASTPTGRVLVETENLLLASVRESGFPAVILRAAGIYGPGRGYWFRQFLAGTAVIEGEGGRILNMIHRDDLVRAIIAALQRGRPGEIYNAVDDEPVSQIEVFRWLASRLGKPMPPSEPENSAVRGKRGATNKRVSNRKLRSELGCHLDYPTFREGFEAALGEMAISDQ